MIWHAAKAGNKAVLQQYLDGASAKGFNFEEKDNNVRHLAKAFKTNQYSEPL
jgi:hypothetical protein